MSEVPDPATRLQPGVEHGTGASVYSARDSQASTEPWAEAAGAIVAGGWVGDGMGRGGVAGAEVCEAGDDGVWVLVISAGEAEGGVWGALGIGAPLMSRSFWYLAAACWPSTCSKADLVEAASRNPAHSRNNRASPSGRLASASQLGLTVKKLKFDTVGHSVLCLSLITTVRGPLQNPTIITTASGGKLEVSGPT